MDGQVANQQTGVNGVPAAEGQNQTQSQQQVQQPQQGQQSQQVANQGTQQGQQNQQQAQQQTPESIPYERFSEVNNKVKELEQQVQMSQQQIALYQANMQNAQAQQPQQQLPNFYEGLEEDDVMTVAEAKKATQAMAQQFQASIGELQFLVQHPDYNQLVGTPQQLGEPLKQAILKNPQIMTEIRHSPNPMLTAYNYAKMAQMSMNNQQQQVNPAFVQAQQQQQEFNNPAQQQQINPAAAAAINAAQMPGSASMVGTNGGFNAANRFASMSDDEFAKYEADVLSKG